MQTLKSDIRKRILTVSKRLFLKNVYRGATTRDIAQGAGITLSNLYHYYASKDARQTIVKLTAKGRGLQEKLMNVPEAVGSAVLCESVTPETVPGLFAMLDDIIRRLDKQ